MIDEGHLSFILSHQVSMLSMFIDGENVLEAWIVALWSCA